VKKSGYQLSSQPQLGIHTEQRRSLTEPASNAGANSFLRYEKDKPGTLIIQKASYGFRGNGAEIVYAVARSSLGLLLVASTRLGVCWTGIHESEEYLQSELRRDFACASLIRDEAALQLTVTKILQFIAASRTCLYLPLDLRATAFQLAVWRELCAIPRGMTRSYGEIACNLGLPRAARAVGNANASNPLAILIPCHRAVGADGKLTGYRWGLECKRRLLEWERVIAPSS
jgi:AraC family transcriptional regulator of adaptative response/methylated-DNA-[protein]-cysteine methyltransferase